MEQAFGWIGDILRWFVHFLPHMGICRATHGGVKFVRGKHIKPIKPGLYFWWPAVTETVIVPAARQSVNLAPQSLTTKDYETVVVSVVLVFTITDLVKALGRSWDVDSTVEEVGGAAAVEVVANRRWQTLHRDLANGEASKELVKRAKALLRPYGVNVLKGQFTDCAVHTVIRTIGVSPVTPVPEEEE